MQLIKRRSVYITFKCSLLSGSAAGKVGLEWTGADTLRVAFCCIYRFPAKTISAPVTGMVSFKWVQRLASLGGALLPLQG